MADVLADVADNRALRLAKLSETAHSFGCEPTTGVGLHTFYAPITEKVEARADPPWMNERPHVLTSR